MVRSIAILVGLGVGVASLPASAEDQDVTTADPPVEDTPIEDGSEEVIVITGNAPSESEPIEYGVTTEEIRTMAGSGNDALKSLQSLPGVARVPFGMGGLILRGASPRDTKVYLDGVEVPLLYHFGGISSFYPSAMLSAVEMQPGGFGAAYGRNQGGIVVATTRRARSDKWRVASEASLIDAAVRADGPAFGGSVAIGLRRSYVDLILAAALPADSDFSFSLAPRYYDGQLRYDVDLSPRDRLSVTVFGADDRLQAVQGTGSALDSFRYITGFGRLSVGWTHREGNVTSVVTPWIGYDRSAFEFEGQSSKRRAVPAGFRSQVTRDWRTGRISGGLDTRYTSYTLELDNTPPPQPNMPPSDDPVVRAVDGSYGDFGAWVEVLQRLGPVRVKPGVRIDRFGVTDQWVMDPRLNIEQQLPLGIKLRQSLGLYHQPPIDADIDPDAMESTLGASRAVHASSGVEVALAQGVVVSATGFYHRMDLQPVDVVSGASLIIEGFESTTGGVASISREFLDAQFGSYGYKENIGRGSSVGGELLVRKPRGRWTGWLAYTLSESRRSEHVITGGKLLPYVADQRHVLTLVASGRLSAGWRIGGRFRLVTGGPYTPVREAYFDSSRQRYIAVPGDPLSERLPAFAQLDLRVDKMWRRRWGTISLFLDVQNVTHRRNAEGVSYNFDYTKTNYTRGLPIFPSLGLEVAQ